MSVVAERCPSCGAALTIEAGRCAFCGVPVVVDVAGAVSQPVPAAVVDPNAPFAMQVDDVFFIKGRGTIATGKIASGTICVGDAVVIDGGKRPTKTTCTGIEMFRKQLEVAKAGDNVGLLFADLDQKYVNRGDRIHSAG